MRRLLCLLLSAATLFLLASCDTAGSGVEETEPPPQGGADYTYGEDAEPVDLGETSVAQKTGSEIVFETSGSDLDIEEGEVIISDVPESELETAPRFLRKVEKVQEEGGQVTVETSQAALVDAVEEASLDFSTSVGGNSKKGRSTTWKVTSTAKGVKADGCESVQLKDVDLISSDALSAGLTNGAISFCPDITGEIDIGAFSIEKFSTVASGELTYSTDISATASATVENSGSVELAAFETYGIVGPVQYTMELSLVAGYEAQAGGTAGVTTGIESGGSLKLGARYEDGAWTPVSEQGLSFNARPVEWGKEAGVTVKGYVRPEITVFIYDTAGPSLFSGPYVELVAERSEDLVKDYRYGAFGGLNGGVGYDIEILTFDVAEYNKSLFELRTEIAGEGPTNPAPNDPEAPSPSSGATVGSRNPTLTWDASDPDNDDLTYDVHLGPSSSPAQVAGGLTSKSYETEGLQSGTTYNWKVVVTDQDGATTEGPVWSFATPSSRGGGAYDEDFSTDPNYTVSYSGNTEDKAEAEWDTDQENYYARVKDQTSDWWSVGISPSFEKLYPAEDSFKLSFRFNPVEPDWGHYPGIYLVDSESYNPGDNLRDEAKVAAKFSINWADNTYKKFVFGRGDNRYRSPTIPNENEWYKVAIDYDGSTGTTNLKIIRENGEVFVDERNLSAVPTEAFDQLWVGEVGSGPTYGDEARIRVDNLTLTVQ